MEVKYIEITRHLGGSLPLEKKSSLDEQMSTLFSHFLNLIMLKAVDEQMTKLRLSTCL